MSGGGPFLLQLVVYMADSDPKQNGTLMSLSSTGQLFRYNSGFFEISKRLNLKHSSIAPYYLHDVNNLLFSVSDPSTVHIHKCGESSENVPLNL